MKISVAKREYLVEIEVRKFTPRTIKSYRNNLNLFLRFCEEEAGITEIEELTLSVVRQFSIYMSSKGKKGSYINGLLKVAKAFIQYCYDEGYGGFNTKKNFKWCIPILNSTPVSTMHGGSTHRFGRSLRFRDSEESLPKKICRISRSS